MQVPKPCLLFLLPLESGGVTWRFYRKRSVPADRGTCPALWPGTMPHLELASSLRGTWSSSDHRHSLWASWVPPLLSSWGRRGPNWKLAMTYKWGYVHTRCVPLWGPWVCRRRHFWHKVWQTLLQKRTHRNHTALCDLTLTFMVKHPWRFKRLTPPSPFTSLRLGFVNK